MAWPLIGKQFYTRTFQTHHKAHLSFPIKNYSHSAAGVKLL